MLFTSRKKAPGRDSSHHPTATRSRHVRRLRCEPLEERRMLSVIPNDPLFSDQWALHNTGQNGGTLDADIDTPEAWAATTGVATSAVVSGTVFNDLDADGIHDANEPGIGETVVVLEPAGSDSPVLTITNPTPNAEDAFGSEVVPFGDDLLVRVRTSEDGISNSGAVLLLDGESGAVIREFANPTPAVKDAFGLGIAVVGDKIVITADKDDTMAEDAGAAYVFDAATGNLLHTLFDPSPDVDDHFGRVAKAYGDHVLIGAHRDDTGAKDAGCVFEFDVESGQFVRDIPNPDPGVNDFFGARESIAVVGNDIVIAARYDDTAGSNAGAVYLFDGTTGDVRQTILNPNPENVYFGWSVSAAGEEILIGSPHVSGEGWEGMGRAYLADPRTGDILQTYMNPDPNGVRIGRAVAAIGDHVLVGAGGDTSPAEYTYRGLVHEFHRDTGEHLRTLQVDAADTDGRLYDGLGAAITTLDGRIVVGAWADDSLASRAGAVYFFDDIQSTVTDSAGEYTFVNVAPGDYTVRQIIPEGHIQTSPTDDGHAVVLAAGQDVTGLDFGNTAVEIELFSDSFENGQWNTKWIEDSQNDWFTSTQRATDGSYSAEVDGSATDAALTVAQPVDLTPYGGAELTFDWYIESGLDAGEYLALDLFDGSNWHEAARLSGNVDTENTWHTETVVVDGGYLVDDFRFRFRAKMSWSYEDANLDNVRLVATSLAGPPNLPPLAVDDAAVTDEDAAVLIDVLANDSDPDGTSLAIDTVTQGARGTVAINGDQTLTYTPNANFFGSDSFDYTIVDDQGAKTTATVSVTIYPINDPPTAMDDTASTEPGVAVKINVLANDFDPDGDALSVVSVTQGTAGTVIITAHDEVAYTPGNGFWGADSFTYTVVDGDGSLDTATVTVTENASETVVFSDSFEVAEWNGLWVEDSQNDWFRSKQRTTDGYFSAEIDGRATNATLTTAVSIDVSGYGTATLTFSWFIEKGWDLGEYIAVDIYYAGSWQNDVLTLRGNVDQENVWHDETVDLAPYLADDFKIRFRSQVSGSREDGNVDNVQIIAGGVSIGSPPAIDQALTAWAAEESSDDTLPALDVIDELALLLME